MPTQATSPRRLLRPPQSPDQSKGGQVTSKYEASGGGGSGSPTPKARSQKAPRSTSSSSRSVSAQKKTKK